MQHIEQKQDIFTDIIQKINSLTLSQQKLIQELLSREKVINISKKNLLKKSFGIWKDRKDITDTEKYVEQIRTGWGSRLERLKD